jgi:type II secretory pathway pseudopilin PulG
MLLLKRGAMFGLDARIALAIFGALSVISGAALYSAIQDSKATAILSDMQEIGKAWEQYLLDTGKDLPLSSDPSNYQRKTYSLVSDSSTGWKGPYLPYKQSASFADYIQYKDGMNITMPATSKLEWGLGHSNPDWAVTAIKCNETTIKCYTTVQISFATASNKIDSSVMKIIDEKADGSDGPTLGKFRWYTYSTSTILAYQYAAYKKPV